MREDPAGEDSRASWGARLLGAAGVPLILASASPRRAELLRGLGIDFAVHPVPLDESPHPGETATATALRLAREKAVKAFPAGFSGWVVGADTLVVLGDEVLGKPASDAEARGMLRRLARRTHEVVTGLAVVRTRDQAVFSGAETTRVTFRPLTDREIEWMVASGESGDKAGGYGIQGLGSLAVSRIEGDYFNVMGLPLGLLKTLFGKAATS